MKQHFLRGICCAALTALLLLSSGCGEKVKIDVHLTYDAESNTLVDPASGRVYAFASVAYEPAYVGDPYADWGDIILHEVDGFSPEKLLTEAWEGVGSMVYAVDSPLPTLKEMQPDKIMVCTTQMTTACIMEILDLETVTEAVYYLETGENVAVPEHGTSSYSMKFCSEDYEGLYYNVIYIAVGEGENTQAYLYDRSTKKCAAIPYDVFFGTMYSDEEDPVMAESGMGLGEGEEIEIGFE